MPSYLELAKEPAWGAEFAPPNLNLFYQQLRQFYGLGPAAIGGKGDNRHLSGYHRSRRWIKESIYCTNRTYSVTRTEDRGGDDNWLAALDATIPAQQLHDACHRLDAAVRAGQLPQVAQWFGTFDGETVVGWSYGQPAKSDDSHLFHLHISFYRSLANADETQLYGILTGTSEGDDTMAKIGLFEDADNPGHYFFWDGWERRDIDLSNKTIYPNGIGDIGWVISGKAYFAPATGPDPNFATMMHAAYSNPVIPTGNHVSIPRMSTVRFTGVESPECVGEPGPAGPPGATGATGPTGPAGPAGPAGVGLTPGDTLTVVVAEPDE